MTLEFFDRQQASNPANGSKIETEEALFTLLDALSNRVPFFCELVGDNGYKQLVGVGGKIGCVQYNQTNGSPPYLMAMEGHGLTVQTHPEFLIGNTPTPVSTRYCMPLEKVKQIAGYFLKTGSCDPSVSWEEI